MLTRHAEARCQQRGIRPEVVDVLMTYGRRRTRHGAEVCFMDRRARDRAQADLGSDDYRRIADRLDAYLVVSGEGEVITAAKRRKRLKF